MVFRLSFKVIVWFIIAIARLRFPSDQSIPMIIRRRYGDNAVVKMRKFEKVDRKLRKAELDLTFLLKCAEHSLIPKFLNFKVSNDHLRRSETYEICRKRLLAEETCHKKSSIRSLRKVFSRVKEALQLTLNIIDYSHVLSCFLQSNDKFINTHKDIQDKKLLKLLENNTNFRNDPSKVIHNLSSYKLSKLEENLLVKGLNFSINPKKLNYLDYCVNFELLFRDIRNQRTLPCNELDYIRTRIKDVALSTFKEYNDAPHTYNNLTKEEMGALKSLSSNKELVIQKSDKGNAVVILNKSDYTKRVKEILGDSSKFQTVKIKEDKEIRYMLNLEGSFKKVFQDLLKKGKISQKVFSNLNPVGSRPGVLYGLSKVHKALVNGLPKVRPILSAIGTPSYALAKFLIPILSAIVNGPYTIVKSFDFNKEILVQDASLIMGSLDVDALFTSIPLNETIGLVGDQLFKENAVFQGFNKNDIKTLLELACKNSLFLFDGEYYFQTDGVAMGSPLGPTLANIFMSYHEQIWLDNCPLEFKPKLYRRYVDDIFIMVEKEEHIDKFKDYLNTKHKNIKFTKEIEVDGKLPFLDLLIDRNEGKMVTSVYRKPTFTGVYTHFHSFIPSIYKFGLLSTLLFRYFSICSSFSLFHLEVVHFKKLFLKNGYPIKVIDFCIEKFLNKIFVKRVIRDTVPKKGFTIVLPYLGILSGKTQKRLRGIFQKSIPWGKIHIIFKTQCRISHILKYKDVTPKDLVSHVIYSYKCPSCNAGYVGETERHSKVRWSEHLGISCFTYKPVVGTPTAVREHLVINKCESDLSNFKIVSTEVNKFRRLIKEGILIKYYNYELNKQIKSSKLYLF